jgi:hypothetical protein
MSRKLNTSSSPPRRSSVLWVECIRGNERQKFTVYSPVIFGVYQHWTGRRTVPCWENHELCQGGHRESTLKWRGYIHAWSYTRNSAVFVQLTGESIDCWWNQIARGVSLRGQQIYVVRSKADNGRLFVEVDKYSTRDANKLPEPLDPRESLFKMWGLDASDQDLRSSLVSTPEELPDLGKIA